MKTIVAILFMMLGLVGCASMQQTFVESTCNKDGAFQKGYNEAKNGNDMNNVFAGQCPAETQDVVKQSYREGFLKAKAQQPMQINISTGGSNDQWMCKDSFGEKICGYNCLEAFGKVKCARVSGDNCISAYGDIRCGLHCYESYGNIKCDSYE